MRRFATAYLTRTAELYSRFRETVSRRRLSGEPELGRGDWDQQPAPDLDRVQPAGGDLLKEFVIGKDHESPMLSSCRIGDEREDLEHHRHRPVTGDGVR